MNDMSDTASPAHLNDCPEGAAVQQSSVPVNVAKIRDVIVDQLLDLCRRFPFGNEDDWAGNRRNLRVVGRGNGEADRADADGARGCDDGIPDIQVIGGEPGVGKERLTIENYSAEQVVLAHGVRPPDHDNLAVFAAERL